jgi:hypothetical protein
MRMLAHGLADWADLHGEEPDEEAALQLRTRLKQLLGAERLLVLAGLGTSRCVTAPQPAPTMHDLWERAKSCVGDARWGAALEAAGWREEYANDIELLLSRSQMILALRGEDGDIQSFVADCEAEIVSACRFVVAGTDLSTHEAFLRRVARRPARLPRVQLYTTNYDLAFETAASRTGFAVIDGFSHVAPQRFDGGYFDVDFAIRDRERAASIIDWMPNVLQLLKLHGSVDWEGTEQGIVRARGPDRPLIVYPRATKFEASYQQPFLEFMARFQAALRQPDLGLLIVGSGLNDRHIVEPLMAAVRSNTRLALAVVAPHLADSGNTAIDRFIDYTSKGDRRITLVEGTFEDLVEVLPELVPETEVEQHLGRTSG